jgi:hypothetical protein
MSTKELSLTHSLLGPTVLRLHKKLHTFKMIQTTNKAIPRASYLHQSTEKLSTFCLKWLGWLSLLWASTRCHYFWKWLPHNNGVCVLQLAKEESVTVVQSAFRTQFHMELPSHVSISAWHKKFKQKGCIGIAHTGGQLRCLPLHLAEVCNTNNHQGHLKQNSESFSIDWCEVLSMPNLFSVSFW